MSSAAYQIFCLPGKLQPPAWCVCWIPAKIAMFIGVAPGGKERKRVGGRVDVGELSRWSSLLSCQQFIGVVCQHVSHADNISLLDYPR